MIDTLLIVDDEQDLLTGLKRSITQEMDCTVLTATNGKHAMWILQEEPVDVVLTDINMPEMDGLKLLDQTMEHDEAISIIMMTAYGTIEIAVQALKRGAYDFIQKPFEFTELIRLLKKGFERNRLIRENKRMQKQICQESALNELIGMSERMQLIHHQIKTLAKTDVTVLITGETGTGKDLAANAIHEILYADDILLVDEDGDFAQIYMDIIAQQGSHYGLVFNWSKLQYVSIGCDPELVQANGVSIERVANLKYLGGTLSEDGRIASELNAKIGIALSESSDIQRVWSHSNINLQRKLLLFIPLLVAKLLYGHDGV